MWTPASGTVGRMFSAAIRVARIGGIEVRLDPSLLLLVLLVSWAFSTRFEADHGLTVALIMAVTGALLVLLTTLAHELAHAFEARQRNIEVAGVTLFLFGGVTEMHAHGQNARDELAIAVVGPWISLVCGAVFGLIATFADDVLPAAMADPVAEVAGLLGWWNVLIAVFNLVPGAPLDGGRVLRAVLWMALGDRLKALTIAVRVGQALGLGLVAFGVFAFIRAPALWLASATFALVGVFLFNAARKELVHARMDAVLHDRTVGELTGTPPPPWSAETLLDRIFHTGGDLISVDVDGGLQVIEIGALAALHPTDMAVRTAGDIAEPIGEVPTVSTDDDLHTMIERFQGAHHVVGLSVDGQLVAALTEREVAGALEMLRRNGHVRDPILGPRPPAMDVPTP